MTDLLDVMKVALVPCAVRMARAPYWSCGLPRGHDGDHARLAMAPFQV